jgi:hypothetical protein
MNDAMNVACGASGFGPPALVLAESYLQWLLRMLGPFWGLAITLCGTAVFLGALYVVLVNRQPRVIAAYLVFLPSPLFLALFAAMSRPLAAFSVIATSTASPTSTAWVEGLSASLVPPLVALHLTLPSYLLLSFGLLITTIVAARRRTE